MQKGISTHALRESCKKVCLCILCASHSVVCVTILPYLIYQFIEHVHVIIIAILGTVALISSISILIFYFYKLTLSKMLCAFMPFLGFVMAAMYHLYINYQHNAEYCMSFFKPLFCIICCGN